MSFKLTFQLEDRVRQFSAALRPIVDHIVQTWHQRRASHRRRHNGVLCRATAVLCGDPLE